jgi:fatty-acyl-CoA synthase
MTVTSDPAARIPQCTLEQFEGDFAGRHRLHDVVTYWAARRPRSPALVQYGGPALDWEAFHRQSGALAAALVRLGFRKGDFLATSLPFLIEHVLLEYACFRIGVIPAPLDLRLNPAEVARLTAMIRPRGFACLDGAAAPAGAEHILTLPAIREASQTPAEAPDAGATEQDGALVIFTTGSTGAPKPALLSHRNITCQNLCLGAAFGFGERTRLLVNLPPSHVGGQAEALMTTLFWGGTAVLLDTFDAGRSLDAIERYRINLLGQVPTMFQLEWRAADYARYDLSSLEAVIYGGQQVAEPFLERLAAMAPRIGSGLGLTESGGFCTYTPAGATPEELAASIGYDMPVYPMSIREPMREDGSAGAALPAGEIGHICFRGPQTFLGYVGDPAATAGTISADGYLYTGDMGLRDARGLRFAGRAKWVIKPRGYQVFPGDIENHFLSLRDLVASAGAVGVPHQVFSEAIVAFVEKKPGVELSLRELKQHARGLTAYLRPLHYVVLEPGQMPLNRVAKIDYVRLHELALAEVEKLRSRRRWDR